MVRPRKVAKNFVPPSWISESDSEDDVSSYQLLKRHKVLVPQDNLESPNGQVEQSVEQSVPTAVKTTGEYDVISRPRTIDSDQSDPDTDSDSDASYLQSDPPSSECQSSVYSDEEDSIQNHSDIGDISDHDSSNYDSMLDELSKEWMLIELHHQVSKKASDLYWNVALKYLLPLMVRKKEENVTRKIPQFTQIRRKLRQKHVPRIEMELGYRNLTSGEDIHIVSDTIPRSRYPKSQYKQLTAACCVRLIYR